VDDDEEELVVLFGAGALGSEDVVEAEVGRVGQSRLVVAHGVVVTASKWRWAGGARNE
jgi:hypothetical protein